MTERERRAFSRVMDWYDDNMAALFEDYNEKFEAAKCDAAAVMELNMQHVERENAIRRQFWERWEKTAKELKERGVE